MPETRRPSLEDTMKKSAPPTPAQRGLDSFGHPVPADNSRGADNPRGAGKLQGLLKALDDVSLTDQHDLNDFCEAGRKLSHYLAVVTALGAGELEAGAKEMARAEGGFGNRMNVRSKMRRVTKRLNSAAGNFGGAAADFVTAWHTFEQAFDELMTNQAQPKRQKRFTIRQG